MAYITREDGERFVIPSYRDTLTAKKASLLKKQIQLLSADYGEYITFQRKGLQQYEVAFSPDPGYLLGETAWHYFKRPNDLIYCEIIPNTFEAILVIVKNGSVYLDGTFAIDSIPEELLIFRSQQNQFDIYTYGDVPISSLPEEGKFSFDPASVKSFTILDEPAFPRFPLLKTFQLQLVDTVLQAQKIGVFPVAPFLGLIAVIGLVWLLWSFLSQEKKPPPVVPVAVNPYHKFITSLSTPDPMIEVRTLASKFPMLLSVPGWHPSSITYADNQIIVSMRSLGGRSRLLFDWAAQNDAKVEAKNDGFYITLPLEAPIRTAPDVINPLTQVIGSLTDRLSYILPGNIISLGASTNQGNYTERRLTINFANITPATLDLIGQQFQNLPLVLSKVTMSITNANISGSIELIALGS